MSHLFGLTFFLTLTLALFTATVAHAQQLPGQDTTAIDTSAIDSSRLKKNVKVKTQLVSPDRLTVGRQHRRLMSFDLDQLMYPDLLNRLGGFTTSLGQAGKPYRRYRYGIETAFLRNGIGLNPWTGVENIYLLDPAHHVKYYDTRTPFVNVYFGQGKANLSFLTVDVSQNLSPWINVAVSYKRQQSDGVYTEHITSHNNIYASGNLHSKDDRYHLFANWTFQQLNDELNGGVTQEFVYEDLFGKGSQPVSLTDANLHRVQRGLYMKQFYSVLGDTVDNPHRLRIYNSILRDQFENQFTDTLIDVAVNDFQYPVYPTFGDSVFFYERYLGRRWVYREGFTYNLRTDFFDMDQQVGVTNEVLNFTSNFEPTRQNIFRRNWEGRAEMKAIPFATGLDWRWERTTSNFFAPDLFIDVGAHFSFPAIQTSYEQERAGGDIPGPTVVDPDSFTISHNFRPVKVFARYMQNRRNPTLQHAFGDGFGNLLGADRTLRNRFVEHYRVGIKWQGKDKWHKYGVTKGNYLSVAAFQTRQYDMIYYDSTMALRQAPDGQWLQYQGVEGSFRLRLGKFFFENTTVVQRIESNNQELDTLFRFHQPWFYGRAKAYFEAKGLKIAAQFRVGLEYQYHLGYNAPLFDPASQQFYPQNSTVQAGYHRLDAVFGTQVKKAYIYARLVNSLEGVATNGYFTTLFYPMLDRTFMVGLNWSFYD